MTKRLFVVLSALFSISGLSQAASITPNSGVSILYINGQPADDKVGKNDLKDGFNQVVVRMDKDMARSGASSSDVFTSNPYILSVKNVKGDLIIDHPTARSKMEANKAFKTDQPEWIVEQDGNAIAYDQEVLEGKSGLFPYLGMEKLIAEHNQSRGIYFNNGQVMDKPVAVKAAVTSSTDPASVKTAQTVVTSNVEQLKAWYLQSTTEERKAFRRWMIDQE